MLPRLSGGVQHSSSLSRGLIWARIEHGGGNSIPLLVGLGCVICFCCSNLCGRSANLFAVVEAGVGSITQ